ncbi:protein arginine N-methyltransferase 5-like [Daktulosphaira vitifoliae]|uniref:protein arginine N-methyltransferase 5-like n=1 Tax=Daktulosphaira vitifoliae TaxID=58002 RepID=UPI0021AA57C5|nr:protein arginine N-methyltransferase 5-like [Daktulosphaira vitifoliae]
MASLWPIISKIPVNLAYHFTSHISIEKCMEDAINWHCKFICIKLFKNKQICDLDSLFIYSWPCHIIAILPDVDHDDFNVQLNKQKQFNHELSILCGFQVKNFLINLSNKYINLARVISKNLEKQIFFHFKVPIEICSWDKWNNFRNLIGYSLQLGVVLHLNQSLPSLEEMKRWIGEPVVALLIETDIFILNKKNNFILREEHEEVLKLAIKQKWTVMLSGESKPDIINYFYYVLFVAKNVDIPIPILKCDNILQLPLQPLRDNLMSCVYNVFEQDPVKYTQYQKAIYSAIKDRKSDNVVIAVIGAGRGPLVKASLRAADSASVNIKVYAIEKNENAIPTLLLYQKNLWGDSVQIVFTDGRDWDPPEKCDIMVSELLGSFGDNELSPECLDGAQKCLKDDGISIPCQYSSFLRPVMSHTLYSQTTANTNTDDACTSTSSNAVFEQMYVVLQPDSYKPNHPKILFIFDHPSKTISDNSRYKCLEFEINANMQLHGFSGYFHSVLYKDIIISIEPKTESVGMFSWFPVFFPIKDTMLVKAGEIITVHFWRCCNKYKVWYEWCVSSPKQTPVYNCNGESSSMRL